MSALTQNAASAYIIYAFDNLQIEQINPLKFWWKCVFYLTQFFIVQPGCNNLMNNAWFLASSTLGERNPNPELDGLPVFYKPRNFEIFRLWTAVWVPLLVFAGPASFSNLADLMIEFWSDSFSWLFVAAWCCTWLVADIATILSCLCYNLNGQKLSSNTFSTQLPHVLSNFICFNLIALYKTVRTVLFSTFWKS